jgi:hypothetical protein
MKGRTLYPSDKRSGQGLRTKEPAAFAEATARQGSQESVARIIRHALCVICYSLNPLTPLILGYVFRHEKSVDFKQQILE